MDIGDDVWTSQGENVAVVEQIFVVFYKAIAAGLDFSQAISSNGGSHGSIEDHDALGEGRFEVAEEVFCHALDLIFEI